MSKGGLHLANLIAIDTSFKNEKITNNILKPSTMNNESIFVSLGDDGGYWQAIVRAYSQICEFKGIYLKEQGVDEFDFEAIKKVFKDPPEDISDVLYDLGEIDEEQLPNFANSLQGLECETIDGVSNILSEEAENGATFVFWSKNIERKNLWNQEIEFKPYFLYYVITALTCLERNGNFVVKIYDIHTEFSKTLIYLLSVSFSSIWIIQPYSMCAYNSDKFLVWTGMIHKDSVKSRELIQNLKSVYTLLRKLHISGEGDLDTLIMDGTPYKNSNEIFNLLVSVQYSIQFF